MTAATAILPWEPSTRTTLPLQRTWMLSVRVISGGKVRVNSMGEPALNRGIYIKANAAGADVAGLRWFSARRRCTVINGNGQAQGKPARRPLFLGHFGH